MRRPALFLLCALPLLGCSSGGETTSSTQSSSGGPDGGEIVILDGGGDAAVPPDGASMCPKGSCNYQTNMGCDPKSSCLPASDGKGGVLASCFPVGQTMNEQPCMQATDCAPGLLCAAGKCHKMCCGGDWTGCLDASEHCITNVALSDGMGGNIATGAMLCFPVNTCDALAPASCTDMGTTCQIVDPTGATACFPEGTGDPGGACPCKGGSLCVANTCHRLCRAVAGGGEPSCHSGEGECIHYVRDPDSVGECTGGN